MPHASNRTATAFQTRGKLHTLGGYSATEDHRPSKQEIISQVGGRSLVTVAVNHSVNLRGTR